MIQACFRPAGVFLLLLSWGSLLAFDPDVRWDASMAGCNGQIHDLAEGPDGRIYVGGAFSECGSISAAGVAAYDPDTNSWHALAGSGGNGVNGSVNALVFHQGTLFVGGLFLQTNSAEPIPANRLASWDPVSQSWSALTTATGNGVSGQVFDLASHGNELIVGGDFFSANVGEPMTVRNVARWNGTSWAALASADGGIGTSGAVYALASSSDAVYAGGDFAAVSSGGSGSFITANRVARWSAGDGWSALGSGGGNGVNDTVFGLEKLDGQLYVGGMFGLANSGAGITAHRVAVWNGSQWAAMATETGQGASSVGYAFAMAGQRVYLGGVFESVNVGDALPASRVAWWDGESFGTLGSGVDNTVRSILVGSDGWINLAGSFTTAGAGSAGGFARYLPAGDLNIELIGSGDGSIDVQPLGLACSSDCTQTLEWDQSLTLLAAPGPFSVFAGFSGSTCSGTGPCSFDFEQATSIVAQFDLVTYPVEVTSLSGSGTVTPSFQTVEHGSTVNWTVLPDPGWAVHSFSGDTCSPSDNGDGTWSVAALTSACELAIEFRLDIDMSVSLSMNPAVVGTLVTYEVGLSSIAPLPVDGQMTVVASTGENCVDLTTPPPGDGATVFYSCEILYSGTGPRTLLVSYADSTTHVSAADGTIVQQVVGSELIFQDRYEEQ